MSGHSHWAGIKIKKGVLDAKRGKLFSKISRSIVSAVRQWGANPEANLKLKYALERAREANMPKENIDRAIMRGTGELPGVQFEELVYEGFGPGGIAFMVEVVTDNRTRTAAELRHIFERRGGNLAAAGSVSWMFKQRGLFIVEKDSIGEDELMELALELGAEDMQTFVDAYEVYSDPRHFDAVKKGLGKKEIKLKAAEISWIANEPLSLEAPVQRKAMALTEALEDHEDVQTVHGNFDISEEQEAGE